MAAAVEVVERIELRSWRGRARETLRPGKTARAHEEERRILFGNLHAFIGNLFYLTPSNPFKDLSLHRVELKVEGLGFRFRRVSVAFTVTVLRCDSPSAAACDSSSAGGD